MSSIQSIETPQDYVNYTFNLSSRGVTEVTSEIAGMSSTVSNLMGLMAFKTSEYLSNTEALITSFGYAAVAVFSKATTQAIQFEQALANVKAIGGESINEIEIGQAAMKYSNQLGMSVSSMTEGLEALSRAGLTATDVMSNVLAEGVKLSKLEGMDLEDSINNLISTTNLLAEGSYDVNSQEYADMVKAMNQHIVSTSESAPINAHNIIQTLQHVGGYASASGIDQDDLFAVIAQLGSKGTKGEMAGTALRAFIAAGQKDSAQRALKRIGLDVTDLWTESGEAMLPVSEMKAVLDEALEARGYSKQEKLEFYSDFAGYKQANQIMKINTEEVQQYKKSIDQAWDLGRKLDEILGTVHSNIQIIAQTTTNFLTRVGQTALPILNAILQPIKWAVQLIDKIPFSEQFVGLGLAFVGLKGIFTFINRVVPAVASLYTSFDRPEKKAKGIAGHFKNLKRDALETKETIENIRNPEFLARKRMENDKYGMGSVEYGLAVAEDMYGSVHGQDITGKDFWELSKYQRNQFIDYVVSLGKDKQIYQTTQDRIDAENQALAQAIINSEAKSQPIIYQTDKGDNWTGNVERNQEINLQRQSYKDSTDQAKKSNDIAASTKQSVDNVLNATKELISHIKGHTDNTKQYDIGKGIMSVAKPLADIFAETIFKRFNLKEFNTRAGKIQFDSDVGKQASQELENIFNKVQSAISDLPDISFNYDNDIEKMQDKVKTLRSEIATTAKIFSNIDISNMTPYQGRRALKTIDIKAMGNIGLDYSKMMNEAYIREVLKQDNFDKNNKFIEKIYDEQVTKLAESLNIDVSRAKDKVDAIEQIYNEFHKKGQKKSIGAVVKSSTEWYEDHLKQREIPGVKGLTNDESKYIMERLGIQYNANNDITKQLQTYFSQKDVDASTKWLAQELVLAIQKQKAEGVYSGPEKAELEYMVTHLEALNQSINRLINESSIPLSYIVGEERFKYYQAPSSSLSNFNSGVLPTIENMNSIVEDFIDNGYSQINRTLPVAGSSLNGIVELNPDVIANLKEQKTFMEEAFKVYIHEMAHSVLQHQHRRIIGSIPETRNNKVQEIEARMVEKNIAKALGMNVFKDEYRIQKFKEGAEKDGVPSSAIREDLVGAATVAIANHMPYIFANFKKLMSGEFIQNTTDLGVLSENMLLDDPMIDNIIDESLGPLKDLKNALEEENSVIEQLGLHSLKHMNDEEIKEKKEKIVDKKIKNADSHDALGNKTPTMLDIIVKVLNTINDNIKNIGGIILNIDIEDDQREFYQQMKTYDEKQLDPVRLKQIAKMKEEVETPIHAEVGAGVGAGMFNYQQYQFEETEEEPKESPKDIERKRNAKRIKDLKKIINEPDIVPDIKLGALSSDYIASIQEEIKAQQERKEQAQKELNAITSSIRLKEQEERQKENNSKYIRTGPRTWIRNPDWRINRLKERVGDLQSDDITTEEKRMYNPPKLLMRDEKFQKKRNEYFRNQALQLGLIQPDAPFAKPRRRLTTDEYVREQELLKNQDEEKQFITGFMGGYNPFMSQYIAESLASSKKIKQEQPKQEKSNLTPEEQLALLFPDAYEPISKPKKEEEPFSSKLKRAVANRATENSYKEIAEELEEIEERKYDIVNQINNQEQDYLDMLRGLNLLASTISKELDKQDTIQQGQLLQFLFNPEEEPQEETESSISKPNKTYRAIVGKSISNFDRTNIGQILLDKVNNNIKLTREEIEHAISLGFTNIISKDIINKTKDGIILGHKELKAAYVLGLTEAIKLNEINIETAKTAREAAENLEKAKEDIKDINKSLEYVRLMRKEARTTKYNRENQFAINQANEIFGQNFQVKKTGQKRTESIMDTYYEKNYPNLKDNNINLINTMTHALNQDFIQRSLKNGTPLTTESINQADTDYIITRLKQGILQEQDIAKAKSLGLMDESGEFYAKELRILQKNIRVQEALKRKEEKTLALNAERAQIQKRLEEKYSEQDENPMAEGFKKIRAGKSEQRKEAAEKRINDLKKQYDSESEGRKEDYKRNVGLSITEKSITNQKLLGQQFINALNLISKNNKKGYELLEQIPFEDVGGGQMGFQNADADLAIDSESRQRALDIIATMQQQQKELPPILRKFVDISSHYQDVDVSKNLLADITSAIKDGFREANSQMGDFLRTQAAQTEQEEREKLGTVQIGAEDYEPVSTFDDNVTRIDDNTFGKVTKDENAWKMRTDQETKEQQVVKEISTQQSLGKPQTGYEDYVPEDEGDYSQFNPVIWKNPKTGESVVFEAETDIDKTMEHDFDDELYKDYWIELKKQEAELQEERIRQQQKVVEAMNKIVNHETAKRIGLEQQAELAELEQARLEAETQQVIDTSSKKGRADFVSQQVAEQEREKNEKLKLMQEDLLNINTDDYNNIKTIQEKQKEERDAFWKDIEHEEYMASEMFKDEISELIETNKHKLGLTTPKEKDREEERKKLTNQAKIDARYGKFDHISGVSVGTYENEVDESIKEEALKKYGHLYGGTYGVNADYEGLSFLEKEKMKLDHKYGKEYIGGSGEDDIPIKRKQSLGERIARGSLGIRERIHNLPENIDKRIPDKSEETAVLKDKLGNTHQRLSNIIGPMEAFNDALFTASEIFPPLTGFAWGFNTVLQVGQGVIQALELAQMLLNSEKVAEFLADTLLIPEETALTIARWLETGATMTLTGVIGGLVALISGPVLIVIGLVIAALAILYISEKNHAEALKANKKALEESNKSINAAQAAYKSARNARISETNAAKKHQAALKESIALNHLAAERRKRLSEIEKKAMLEHDVLWGETGSLRTGVQTGNGIGGIIGFLSPISKLLAGGYENISDKHSENISQITQIVDTANTDKGWAQNLWDNYDNQYANQVSAYYNTHAREFAKMDTFSPQLEKLYQAETQAQKIYGEEGARNSDMFLRAMQEAADDTGLSGAELGQYLDYMQTEANVENARSTAQSEFGNIVAETQKKAYANLYGDNNYMGDLDDEQYNMVMAVVEEEARKAKEQMFQNAVLEYMAAITSILNGDWGSVGKHIENGNMYLNDMKNIDENKERIAKQSLDIAEEGLRKDYGTQSYSFYGDTPFGGAVASAKSAGMKVVNHGSSQTSITGHTSSSTSLSNSYSDATSAAQKSLDNAAQALHEDYGAQDNENHISLIGKALNFAANLHPAVGLIKSLFGDDNTESAAADSSQPVINKYEININTININTEDDPEKIKTAFMDLMIEMSEQVTPRYVSRTTGQVSNTQEQSTGTQVNYNNNNPNST